MKMSEMQATIAQEALLHRIANRIRQSLELKEILNATVAEVRAYLATDRVKVYQFNPDGSGVVIAESIQKNRLPSLLGLHFPADDIPLYARELFVRARQRSIVDITTHSIGISPLNSSTTGEVLSEQDIRYRPVDPCHVEYLTAMGVKSSVVVPIVLEAQPTGQYQPPSLPSKDHLWGLLVSHHSESKNVTEPELQFIQAVVDQVGVAITQSILLNQVRSQAQQEANINRITALLHTSDKVEWQDALKEAVTTFNGSGGRLYLNPDENLPVELYVCGLQPEPLNRKTDRVIEENLLWQNFLYSIVAPNPDRTGYKPWSVEWMRTVYNLNEPTKDIDISVGLWAIDDLYREPLFRTLAPFFQATKIRSLLIIPLNQGNQVVGCLTIFREEVDMEILWAGWHNPDTRQLMPRQSFEVWQQQKKGQAQNWTEEEIKYAQALSERFSAAIKQYRLYQKIQLLNANLERQVQERTEELQQRTEQVQLSNIELERSVEQQKTLSRIVAKIRESLDINVIFETTTDELSQVLKADRVAVYRFYEDWGGEFVGDFEYTTSEWASVGNFGINTVWNDTYLQENQGGKYRTGEIAVVDNIYQAGYTQCHIDILEQFHINAFILVPIFVKQNLWGLLGVYHHQSSRHWENTEVEFVRQIASQLGVALQHAELLSCTYQQTEQLQQVSEQQEILFNVVAKIRESLDIDTIFNTTVVEVRHLLNTDRVAVFRFSPNSGFNEGEVISEDVLTEFPSALTVKISDHCFGEQFAADYQKGRIQVVVDINNAGLQDCHIAMLSQLHVKAQIVVPLMKGNQLWGLLCIHQCTQPRNWLNSEVQFIQQIAAQLSVALEQADLLVQTKYQAEQLAAALQDLQTTQTQLIQTEKMSSLGQLVAGVAHEINNPVNFIHGNLLHVEEYFHNLMKLIALYQQQLSNPYSEILDLAEELDIEFVAEDLPKTLSSMKIGTERIRQIVLSLQNFSRLDQANIKFVNIHEGIDSTLLILQHRLKAKPNSSGIEVIKEYGDLPEVECYAGLLNQVFMNILSNAIDALEQSHMTPNSSLTVTSLPNQENPHTIWIRTKVVDNSRIAILIQDNGIGMKEEVRKNVFNPFFTTKPVGKGTGLGLSISYQIIMETHKGELKCLSTPGQGTEFIIEIPIQQSVM
jgi:GAF domain-containing protein